MGSTYTSEDSFSPGKHEHIRPPRRKGKALLTNIKKKKKMNYFMPSKCFRDNGLQLNFVLSSPNALKESLFLLLTAVLREVRSCKS
jgi:hypothetical protein